MDSKAATERLHIIGVKLHHPTRPASTILQKSCKGPPSGPGSMASSLAPSQSESCGLRQDCQGESPAGESSSWIAAQSVWAMQTKTGELLQYEVMVSFLLSFVFLCYPLVCLSHLQLLLCSLQTITDMLYGKLLVSCCCLLFPFCFLMNTLLLRQWHYRSQRLPTFTELFSFNC